MKGSNLEDKMMYAISQCKQMDDDDMVAAGRKAKKNKNKCLPFDKLMAGMQEEFAGEACVYAMLGWVDEEGNLTQVNFMTLCAIIKDVLANILESYSCLV